MAISTASKPTGNGTLLGQKGSYAEMTNLAALNNYLYTIESGTLYRTKSGVRQPIGGSTKRTKAT